MSVSIAALGESLLAQGAGEGPLVSVRPHVVLHVAQFCKEFVAGEALENLVLPASFLIGLARLSVAFIFQNHLAVNSGVILFSSALLSASSLIRLLHADRGLLVVTLDAHFANRSLGRRAVHLVVGLSLLGDFDRVCLEILRNAEISVNFQFDFFALIPVLFDI